MDAHLYALLSVIDSPRLTNTSEQIALDVSRGIRALY